MRSQRFFRLFFLIFTIFLFFSPLLSFAEFNEIFSLFSHKLPACAEPTYFLPIRQTILTICTYTVIYNEYYYSRISLGIYVYTSIVESDSNFFLPLLKNQQCDAPTLIIQINNEYFKLYQMKYNITNNNNNNNNRPFDHSLNTFLILCSKNIFHPFGHLYLFQYSITENTQYNLNETFIQINNEPERNTTALDGLSIFQSPDCVSARFILKLKNYSNFSSSTNSLLADDFYLISCESSALNYSFIEFSLSTGEYRGHQTLCNSIESMVQVRNFNINISRSSYFDSIFYFS